MIYSTDKYYDINQYNDFINTLKERSINFNEFINTKNYQFYLETESDPFIIKYDLITKNQKLFLVSKVKELTSKDVQSLTRRNSHVGKSAIQLAYNDAYNDFKDSTVYFIDIKSKDHVLELSKKLGKIYYFGKYFNNRYRIGLTNNSYVRNFVNLDDILSSGTLIQAELNLNYEVFNHKDFLKKYSMTPYFENGSYFAPKIQSFNV